MTYMLQHMSLWMSKGLGATIPQPDEVMEGYTDTLCDPCQLLLVAAPWHLVRRSLLRSSKRCWLPALV